MASFLRCGRRRGWCSGHRSKVGCWRMAGSVWRARMKRVPLSEVKDDLSRYVQLAAREEILVTRHGRPAAVLIGFEDDDDWFDYQLEHDPRFIARMEAVRSSIADGRDIRIEDVRAEVGLAVEPRRRRSALTKRAVSQKGLTKKKRTP